MSVLQETPTQFQTSEQVPLLYVAFFQCLLQLTVDLTKELHIIVIDSGGKQLLRTLLCILIALLFIIPVRQAHIGHIMIIVSGFDLFKKLCGLFLCLDIALFTFIPEILCIMEVDYQIVRVFCMELFEKRKAFLLLAGLNQQLCLADLHGRMGDPESICTLDQFTCIVKPLLRDSSPC